MFLKETGSRAKPNVNERLPRELYKPLIKRFKRRRVYIRFKDNIWAADLAEMGSLSSKNRGVKYLLCAIYVFINYARAKPLMDKKGKTVPTGFIEIVNESNRKPNKLWVDQGKAFYNSPMQKSLDDNNISMHSIYNEGKLVVAERFIKILKDKI